MAARPFLLCALIPMLASCEKVRPAPPEYVPPKIDCGIFDPPAVKIPLAPDPKEKDVAVWQLNAFAWQQYGEHVLLQRVGSAECVMELRKRGIVK